MENETTVEDVEVAEPVEATEATGTDTVEEVA